MRRGFVPEQGDHNREPYRGLGSSNRNDKKREDLSPQVLKVMTHGYQINVDRIQHQLYGHKYDDDILSRKKAEDSDRKDNHAKHHIPV
jgi:hypothetical protein